MASSQEYAEWIVQNQDKKGTPQFETVAQAYRLSRSGDQKPVEPYDVSPSTASLMNVGQAVSFGFGDEIAGLVGGDKQRYRATVDKFRKDYPWSAGIGTVSGAILMPGFAAYKSASPLLAAATTGGIQGTLQGMGEAPDDPKAVVSQGALGGLGGSVLGPAATLGLGVIGNTASAIGSHFNPKWATDVARRRIANAFERDSMNAADVERNMVNLGAEARVADSAGENTRSMLDLNANLPGKTKNDLERVIRNRQATRPERLDDAVYAVNGGYGRGAVVSEALAKQKQDAAAPLYSIVHSMNVPPSHSLVEILDAANKLGAMGFAKKSAIARMEPMSLKDAEVEEMVKTGYNSLMNSVTQKVKGGNPLSMRDLDHVKRGIDMLIEKETDATTGKVSSYGRDLIGLKTKLTDELDNVTTDPQTGESIYKAARDAFAGPAALETALKKGRAFWSKDADSLNSIFADMTQSEQQAFRIGASDALRQKVGSTRGQTELLGMWGDRNIRERFQALLGDDVKFSDVQKLISNEATLKRLESLGYNRNSKTFSRIKEDEDQGLSVMADLAGANGPTSIKDSLLAAVKKNAPRITTPEPVRDEMGRILLGQYQPAEMKALLEAQKELRRLRAVASAQAGSAAGRGSAGGAGLLND